MNITVNIPLTFCMVHGNDMLEKIEYTKVSVYLLDSSDTQLLQNNISEITHNGSDELVQLDTSDSFTWAMNELDRILVKNFIWFRNVDRYDVVIKHLIDQHIFHKSIVQLGIDMLEGRPISLDTINNTLYKSYDADDLEYINNL